MVCTLLWFSVRMSVKNPFPNVYYDKDHCSPGRPVVHQRRIFDFRPPSKSIAFTYSWLGDNFDLEFCFCENWVPNRWLEIGNNLIFDLAKKVQSSICSFLGFWDLPNTPNFQIIGLSTARSQNIVDFDGGLHKFHICPGIQWPVIMRRMLAAPTQMKSQGTIFLSSSIYSTQRMYCILKLKYQIKI